MSLIDRIIRSDIHSQSAYHVPDASGCVKLDAMENPYSLPNALRSALGQHLAQVALNRYPVPSYTLLKQKICRTFGVPDGFDVILGNGSDELISMLSVACARRDLDVPARVLAPVPGFVMYAVSAGLAGLDFIGVPLRPDFTLDRAAMLAAIEAQRPAITYLAYPNNPTGTLFDVADIVAILQAVGQTGIVVVDEAYQPFAQTSFMSRLPEFENLVILRTVSKLGLAGIRLGYMSASTALLAEFEKLRPPYNINVLTQATAEFLLDHVAVLDAQAALIRVERERLTQELTALSGVQIYPSAANFVLLRVTDADAVHARLLQQRVLVKNVGKMHSLLQNCLRVTVGTAAENTQLLQALAVALSS
ncbi:MAG: histidinol-phosphate transaminase [Herbaspirillum sp.]